jgi:hypothetical protein
MQGRVLKEYARDVDDKLHQTEMDSIQARALLYESSKLCARLFHTPHALILAGP